MVGLPKITLGLLAMMAEAEIRAGLSRSFFVQKKDPIGLGRVCCCAKVLPKGDG